MELVLKCEPFLNTAFNADLPPMGEMQPVDQEEADRLKVYLSVVQQQLGELGLDQDPLAQNIISDNTQGSARRSQLDESELNID